MKRLTEKDESPCTCCRGIGICRTDCSYKQLYDRLAEYEDTGLTPKEIEDMVSVREITPEAEYAIDKHANNLIQKLEQLIAQTDEKNELQRYKEAEEQGLLVRLPCKEGTWVYKICMISARDDDYAMTWHQEMGVREVRFQASMRDQFGKTVFLTREEAEVVLTRLTSSP